MQQVVCGARNATARTIKAGYFVKNAWWKKRLLFRIFEIQKNQRSANAND